MTAFIRRITCLCLVGSTLPLSGCLGGAARREALSQREIAATAVQERDSLAMRALAIERRIAELVAMTDSLRRNAVLLEAGLRDRDDQLRAAREELQKLKEIDLKGRRKPPLSDQ